MFATSMAQSKRRNVSQLYFAEQLRFRQGSFHAIR